jgi:hypothetical protein
MDVITQLRKYRFSFSNGISTHGMALFDLVMTFLTAYIIVRVFHIPEKYTRVLYLSLIPFAIIVHLLVKQPTFLNTNLFSYNLDINSISIKAIVLFLSYAIFKLT